MIRPRVFRGTILTVGLGVPLALTGCDSSRVVYKTVPEYWIRKGLVPERATLADGTVVVYKARTMGTPPTGDTINAEVSAGATSEGGTPIVAHALMPEQVLTNVLQCLLQEDYATLWDQVLSERTRSEYERGEETRETSGYEEFASFMARNRDDLYGSLNRMNLSLRSPEVIIEPGPFGGTRCRFHHHFAKEFKFAALDMVLEDSGLKLLMIHPYIAP